MPEKNARVLSWRRTRAKRASGLPYWSSAAVPSHRPDREWLGAVIESKRRECGYSQERLGWKLKRQRSAGWVSRIERGDFVRLPAIEEFRDLCRLLSLNPCEVLLECGFLTEAEVARAAALTEDRHAVAERRA